MPKRKSNAVITAYRKQRRRIQSLIRSYTKKGFDVQFEISTIPKKITQASVRRLQRITPEVVRKKTYAIDLETGEQISYYRGAQQLRRIRKQSVPEQISAPISVKASTVIINSFRYQVSMYPGNAQRVVLSWLKRQIDEYGEERVSEMLQKTNSAGVWLQPREAYKDEAVKMMLSDMLDYLDVEPEDKQRIMDEIESEYNMWDEY